MLLIGWAWTRRSFRTKKLYSLSLSLSTWARQDTDVDPLVRSRIFDRIKKKIFSLVKLTSEIFGILAPLIGIKSVDTPTNHVYFYITDKTTDLFNLKKNILWNEINAKTLRKHTKALKTIRFLVAFNELTEL